MLTAHHLSKAFDSQSIFTNITFSISAGDHFGLVGPNGCGKTTLLRILAGLEAPTSGHVRHDQSLRIGYLAQGYEPDPVLTLGELISEYAGQSRFLYTELERCAEALVKDSTDAELQTRYDSLVHQVEFAENPRTGQILNGFGLAEIDPDLPVRFLSGGQKTRLSLARLLLEDPELLLLDEPTNHLDIAMLEWLERWLVKSTCAMLIVSHDRTFLDRTVNKILEMDPQRDPECSLHEYAGNYSAYLEQRQTEIEKQWNLYQDQQQEIKRIKADIARTKAQAEYTERQASSIRIGGPDMKIKGYKSYQQGIAKKVAAKAKARESRLDQYLASDDRVEKPRETWQLRRGMRLTFEKPQHLSQMVLRIEDARLGYDQAAPILSNLDLDVQAGSHIAITGPNGAGKTTLLRTIVGSLPLLSGAIHLGSTIHLGYMSQDQSDLDPNLSALETLQAVIPNETHARNFLAQYLLTGNEPLKLNQVLSYGQRARLMLALLVAEGCNLLLLDEPINHLDIPSRSQFESALKAFSGTILAVVHDRYFIERFADETWWVDHGGIKIRYA